MKRKTSIKIAIGIVTFIVLFLFIVPVIAESWIGVKIKAKLSDKVENYIVEIGKIHFSLIRSEIELDNITILSKQDSGVDRKFSGEIASIKFIEIGLIKAMFGKDINIGEAVISNTNIKGKIPFPKKAWQPIISTLNIRIDSVLFDNFNMAVQDSSSSAAYLVKGGFLEVYDFQIEKQDTLSSGIVKNIDFNAIEVTSVSADSMNTFTASGIRCSGVMNTLMADSFSILPNYKDYDFTARHKYQIDRIEARLKNIYLHDFSAFGYISSKKLVSTYVEIGKMDMKVFRDKRKKLNHVNKPAFQDMIYNYPGIINIDSIGLINGNVTYTEHAEKANAPGSIRFNEINAKIYKITNDTIYKTEKAYLQLKAEALLMGKGKITAHLKGRLFDSHNTFSVNGTLSGMDVKNLNPMLEKNAFVYATSGRIDAMKFNFTANNAKATGKMILLYHGLNIAVKNKRTDDTTAIKERVTSIIANIKVIDTNPIPKETVREGIIDNARDPERFVFNYCAKSIMSGIKSSLVKSPRR